MQMNFNDVSISKSLSWLLRHAAVKEGLEITSDGFVKVQTILDHQRLKNKCTIEDINRIVQRNNKQRFTLKTESDGTLFIKANQGHSLQAVTDLDLQPIIKSGDVPAAIHGTYYKNWEVIKCDGLNRMTRLHIHFASGLPKEGGVISGARQNCQLYIYIDLNKALSDGLLFFKSPNGVILSSGNRDGVIETKYFLKVIDAKSGKNLAF